MRKTQWLIFQEILKKQVKWDTIDLVDLVDLTGHAELFGDDSRPRPHDKPRPREKTKSKTTSSIAGSNLPNFKDNLQNEFSIKREAAQSVYKVVKEKDQTIMRLEEINFHVTSTKDMSNEDAYMINMQKEEIRGKYRVNRN